ncbi:putative Alcohol dehydrogenase [Quillaja saponaria]|uniref:Alcohol dehydrogenase n=1 Tax=Quillaja saponaria TaxID=32244 RepID=A0AAD7KQ57_QUISA|nr:putative Alcohol dehydrogenase [Quillaja saponaria]
MANLPEQEHPRKAFGWAARDSSGVLSPFNLSRRATGERDVCFKVLYCGICHSDLHMVKNEWRNSIYPIVPGHEIAGIVTEVGSKVQKFKVGDRVGVGCMVGSCNSCESCSNNLENYCPKMILTYSANPMRYYGLDKPGLNVGVVGLGGLGHVAVKFLKSLGAKVTVISTSPNKMKEAIENLGADSFLVSRDQDQMQAVMNTMDGIIDTVSAVHPLLPLLGLLKANGKLIMLGAPEKPLELPVFPLIQGRKMLAGSAIGGIKETQEMIDFAAKHKITPDIEVIPIDYVNTAMERLLKGDVKYRFVIDLGNTLKSSS